MKWFLAVVFILFLRRPDIATHNSVLYRLLPIDTRGKWYQLVWGMASGFPLCCSLYYIFRYRPDADRLKVPAGRYYTIQEDELYKLYPEQLEIAAGYVCCPLHVVYYRRLAHAS